MKITETDRIRVIFNVDEARTLYKIIRNCTKKLNKNYRKINRNWVIVMDLLECGSGYSKALCEALNVNPDSYIFEEEEKNNDI